MSVKAMFLLLDTNNHAELVKAKIEDGCVIIKDKQFIIDTSNPILLKKGMGVKPLYILKWSATQPSTNIHNANEIQNVEDTKISVERVKTRFEDKYELTPEMLRKIMGLKILGNMIKVPKKSILGSWGWILITLVVGVLAVYVMILMGLIKI